MEFLPRSQLNVGRQQGRAPIIGNATKCHCPSRSLPELNSADGPHHRQDARRVVPLNSYPNGHRRGQDPKSRSRDQRIPAFLFRADPDKKEEEQKLDFFSFCDNFFSGMMVMSN